MNIKDYIISLIDKFLLNPVYSNEDKNLAYFSNVFDEIKNNNDYIYDFIIGINEDLLAYLLVNSDVEDTENFYNKFNEFKNKIVLNKNNKSNFKLAEEEKKLTEVFLDLIKNKVYEKDDIITNYELFKAKLQSNIELDEIDYDLAENLLYLYETDNFDQKFEDVMEYLNRYNISLIRTYGKAEKKKVVYKKVEESGNNLIKELSDPVKDAVKEEINPFEMVNFRYIPKERTRVNKKRKFSNPLDDDKSIDKLFKKYNIEFNEINEFYRNKLKSEFNYDKFNDFIDYLFNNGYEEIVSINYIKNLAILLCDSSLDKFKDIIILLKNKYKINDKMIIRICKMYTRIFTFDNLLNFEGNVRVLKECGYTDFNDVLLNNISFFYEDFNNNILKLEELNSLGIMGKNVIKDSINLFVNNFDLVIENINILDSYGFDLRDEKDFKSFSILGMKDLAIALDIFVEMGYSEYIHDDPTLTVRNIKSLIIKRILYSYKNGINLWDNSSQVVRDNIDLDYERKLINRKVLGEKEISDIIYNYPILGYFQNGLRVNNFNESYFGLIKRRTELVLNGKIISRIKVYSIFNALIGKGAPIENSLLYAFTYNMDLTIQEYDEIKNYIYKMVGDEFKW